MNKADYAQTEKVLRAYPLNIKRLERLITEYEELSASYDMRAQSYEGRANHKSSYADPVCFRVIKLDQLEHRAMSAAKEVMPVTLLMRSLIEHHERPHQIILEAYYFENLQMTETMKLMRCGRRKFSICRDELLKLANEYLRAY